MPYLQSASSNLSYCNVLLHICLIAMFYCNLSYCIFGTKYALFQYFWNKILKNCCHIWNQHLHICLTAKFYEKTKIPKLATTNALFGYFWSKMHYLGNFEIEVEKKHCHIRNQRSWISLVGKFSAKRKILKFETKNVWFRYFWGEIWS